MNPSSYQESADVAAARFEAALTRLQEIEERKAGYGSDQPRVPAGSGRQSGEWTRMVGAFEKLVVQRANDAADSLAHAADEVLSPFKPAAEALVRAAPPQVRRFVADNMDAIQRTLGAVQSVGGGAEIVQGSELIEGGVATLPEGAPALLAAAVLAAHGADDFRTGLRVLATGQAQPGAFYTMLRGAGLDDNAAQLALASAAGIPAIAAAHVPLDALQTTAEAALERDSLISLFARGKVITEDGSSAFATRDITKIGELTERDAHALYGGDRTGPTFKTFDIVVDNGDGAYKAISVKSLNAKTDRYLQADPETMLPRMKSMIDDVAKLTSTKGRLRAGEPFELTSPKISERQLDLYLPAGVLLKGQHAQVATARAYSARRGVAFVVHYVH